MIAIAQSPKSTRVAIVGAGAIGLWIGAKLAQAGCSVSALARGATLAALREHGMRLESSQGPLISAAVQASNQAADLGVQDLVVIAVKAPALGEVAATLAPLIGPQTVVMTAMNGVPWWFFEGFGGQFAGSRLQSIDADGHIARALRQRFRARAVAHLARTIRRLGKPLRGHLRTGLHARPLGTVARRLAEHGLA